MQGALIPNNSLVDIDDILYTAPIPCCNEFPSNIRPDLHDQALLCVTDLTDCCESPSSLGNWYYPNGSTVQFDAGNVATLLANRGQNVVINGRQFYGSVRLFRRYGRPPGRGRFHCELPSAADPSTNQILYANICEFAGTSYLPQSKCNTCIF